MQNPIFNVIIYTSVVSFTFLISLVGVSTKLCVKHNDLRGSSWTIGEVPENRGSGF